MNQHAAQACATTPRRAGADAVPVVIGQSSANGEVLTLATTFKMGWRIGDDVSDAYIAFRKLADSVPA